MALWEQLEQQGKTSAASNERGNEQPITPCDISHHLLQLVTPFTVPGVWEVCQPSLYRAVEHPAAEGWESFFKETILEHYISNDVSHLYFTTRPLS